MRDNPFNGSFLASGVCGQILAFLGLWQLHSNLCLCLHIDFCSMRLCISDFSYKDTRIGYRAHHKSRGLHLEIFNVIMPVKTLFPNKVTFTSATDLDLDTSFERTQFNPLNSLLSLTGETVTPVTYRSSLLAWTSEDYLPCILLLATFCNK